MHCNTYIVIILVIVLAREMGKLYNSKYIHTTNIQIFISQIEIGDVINVDNVKIL